METQGTAVDLPGPDFFIIDFTPEKTRALALSRRFRDLGRAVARDIISRPLEESLAYARQQRARWALVIGDPGRPTPRPCGCSISTAAASAPSPWRRSWTSPAGYFPVFGGGGHA